MPDPSTRGPHRGPNRLSSSGANIPQGGIFVKNPGFPARLMESATNWFRGPRFAMNAEEIFLANVPTIDRIAAFICRRHHMADDAEEFASQVKLDLIERNYEIIRKFEGRATFSTYLTTVMHRLFYQYRVREWGKWRPS